MIGSLVRRRLLLLLLAIPTTASAQKKIMCPDGSTRLEIDLKQVELQYQAPSFHADILDRFHLGVNATQVQQAAESTQQWNEYLKGLVLGWNSCAISKEQYAAGVEEIYPRLKRDATQLNQVAPNKQNEREVRALVEHYLADLKKFGQIAGQLYPGTDPDPPTQCRPLLPPDVLKIFLGNSMAWTPKDEHVVIRVDGENILSLKRIGTAIAISAIVRSKDGRVVAEIANNHFHINPNNYFRTERHNSSSLIVYDQQDRKVLDVRYLNRSSILFLGIFEFPDRRPVVIEPQRQRIGMTLAGFCAGDNEVDFDLR